MNFSKDATEQDRTYDIKSQAVLDLPQRKVFLKRHNVEEVKTEHIQVWLNDQWITLPSPEQYDEFYDQYLA